MKRCFSYTRCNQKKKKKDVTIGGNWVRSTWTSLLSLQFPINPIFISK